MRRRRARSAPSTEYMSGQLGEVGQQEPYPLTQRLYVSPYFLIHLPPATDLVMRNPPGPFGSNDVPKQHILASERTAPWPHQPPTTKRRRIRRFARGLKS